MSTLLTPIITQLELDRERFKQLINGDEFATVQLEFRIEKSIAGMVKQRITEAAIDIESTLLALSEAIRITAASERNALASENAANTASTNANLAVASVEQLKDEVGSLRDETLDYYNKVADLFNANDSTKDEISLSNVYPISLDETTLFNKANLHLDGQPFESKSIMVEWDSRSFEIIQFGAGVNPYVDGFIEFGTGKNFTPLVTIPAGKNDSVDVSTVLTDGIWYGWRFEDLYKNVDIISNDGFNGSLSKWTFFKVGTAKSLVKPVLTTTQIYGQLSPKFNTTGTVAGDKALITSTRVNIYNEDNRIVDSIDFTGFVDTNTLSGIEHGKNYNIKVQYTIKDSTNTFRSPFSNVVGFKTASALSLTPFVHKLKQNVLVNGAVNIDLKTIAPSGWVYDYESSEVTVKVLDTTVGSATLNMWIDGDGVVLTGINSVGVVKVVNLFEKAVDIMVVIKTYRNEVA